MCGHPARREAAHLTDLRQITRIFLRWVGKYRAPCGRCSAQSASWNPTWQPTSKMRQHSFSEYEAAFFLFITRQVLLFDTHAHARAQHEYTRAHCCHCYHSCSSSRLNQQRSSANNCKRVQAVSSFCLSSTLSSANNRVCLA